MTQGFAYSLAVAVTGQSKRAVADDVSGTYERDDHSSTVEVRLLADRRIQFALSAATFLPPPFRTDIGPNLGFADGIVPLVEGTAAFSPTDKCTLSMHFSPNHLRLDQQGGDCGFGFGVTAAGNYRRASLCASPEAVK
jgi:hypothetical protein